MTQYFWVAGAYIDLNAFRAGLCQKPEDYRYLLKKRNLSKVVEIVLNSENCSITCLNKGL